MPTSSTQELIDTQSHAIAFRSNDTSLLSTSDDTNTTIIPGGSSSGSNGDIVTISVTNQGRQIGEAEIFVGIVAAEALLFSGQYEPKALMPPDGIRITFTAGLRHAIDLDPLAGKRPTWGNVGAILKQLSYYVYKTQLSREFVFVARVNSVPFLRGVVHDVAAGGADERTS